MTSVAMSPDELITTVCPTIGTFGAAYYFAPRTLARGRAMGLDGFRFYFLGRGGVLGDVEAPVVASAFGYFELSLVQAVWDSARAKAERPVPPVGSTWRPPTTSVGTISRASASWRSSAPPPVGDRRRRPGRPGPVRRHRGRAPVRGPAGPGHAVARRAARAAGERPPPGGRGVGDLTPGRPLPAAAQRLRPVRVEGGGRALGHQERLRALGRLRATDRPAGAGCVLGARPVGQASLLAGLERMEAAIALGRR